MAENIPAPEAQVNGGGTLPPANPSEQLIASKRQRRPSVRLGDIGGDQHYDTHPRRSTKPWRIPFDGHHQHHHLRKDNPGKPSKTRPLTNLSSGGGAAEFGETLEGEEREGNIDSVVIGSWKVKDSKKRGAKRVRSNWVSRIDDGTSVGGGGGGGSGGGDGEGEDKYSGGEDVDDGYRDFDVENTESPLKDQSPLNSMENLDFQGNRRNIRVRVSEGAREHLDGVELSGPSDNNGIVRENNNRNGRGRYIGDGNGVDGVRVWLNGLGLGRYAPVFEIHEVDDEVLPLLTLEDLKDMGINAVGSRRKMYSAIQKLGKGFS
ncbi:hypothetical protein HN51_020687 [Arachis hypogaea]|uniref:SAM domain-containing protein n=2 Tax=Arachis TaxID=3817 RepID=A0A445C1X2_ARAHY|nr:developmental regulatory protein wetA-like [Arachis duranensis]XP_025616047.1 developmental regulatory protein wetA-like [Arachis hypogaea]QHO32699.1 uncharacterized protein DS421_8g251980 [Arachis hypogaea]RYR44918.1 hypothetical protein Ahy_A08g041185 isoform C [Arachis hypogaea]